MPVHQFFRKLLCQKIRLLYVLLCKKWWCSNSHQQLISLLHITMIWISYHIYLMKMQFFHLRTKMKLNIVTVSLFCGIDYSNSMMYTQWWKMIGGRQKNHYLLLHEIFYEISFQCNKVTISDRISNDSLKGIINFILGSRVNFLKERFDSSESLIVFRWSDLRKQARIFLLGWW